ncbi:hypothetical protein GCM10010404_70310 [Nonomuraea africana]
MGSRHGKQMVGGNANGDPEQRDLRALGVIKAEFCAWKQSQKDREYRSCQGVPHREGVPLPVNLRADLDTHKPGHA